MSAIGDEYSQIGNPNGILKGIDVLDPRAVDPVEMCLPGRFMNKAALSNFTTNNCPRFMVQRCANKWDKYCEIYINESLKSLPGEANDQELFIKQMIDHKFCRLDTSNPNSKNCKTMQELFDPTLINSPVVSSDQGSIVYTEGPLDGYKETGGCFHKCDNIDLNTIEDDPLFQVCLKKPEEDPYRSVIDNVCLLANQNGYSIKGDRLKELCGMRRKDLTKFKAIVKKAESPMTGSEEKKGNNNMKILMAIGVVLVVAGAVMAVKRR